MFLVLALVALAQEPASDEGREDCLPVEMVEERLADLEANLDEQIKSAREALAIINAHHDESAEQNVDDTGIYLDFVGPMREVIANNDPALEPTEEMPAPEPEI